MDHTREGFLSAVQDRDDKNKVRVRARTERHIRQFAEEIEAIMDTRPDARGPGDIIDMEEEDVDGGYDYRWVLTIPKDAWGDYLLTVELPDSHVKEHVSRIGTDNPDHVLYDFVLDVWTRAYRMQSGVNPFAARRSYQNDFDWDSIPDLDDTDPTPPHGIPRVDKNPFAEAARDVSKSVTGVVSLADYQEEEDDRGVTVVLTDGTEFDLDIEYDPAETDEWYDTVLLPAVKAAGYDTDLIDDFWAISDGVA